MKESVFEKCMFADIKNYKMSIRVGLHSARDNLLQTGALADSTELRYTETIYFEQISKPLRQMFL